MSIVAVKAVRYYAMQQYLQKKDSMLLAFAQQFDRVWIISITGPDESHAGPLVTDAADRIALSFHDIDPTTIVPDEDNAGHKLTFFDETMAQKVCAFIRNAHDSNVTSHDLLLVNCHMGVSRSGAIADFARTICNVPYETFQRMNPHILPNRHVLQLLYTSWLVMFRHG